MARHRHDDHHRDVHGGGLRAAVFGASDGLVSNVLLIIGLAGASASADVVMAAGIAGLLAGAISMASGEYVSVRAHNEVVRSEFDQLLLDNALEKGVTLLYGTDAAVLPHDMGGWQFATMVERGMRPMDAIRSATSVAAEHMGLSADVGAVAPGRIADLIAVRGDPLADTEILRDVAVVMQAGVIVKTPARE